jgi:hypothetical protein
MNASYILGFGCVLFALSCSGTNNKSSPSTTDADGDAGPPSTWTEVYTTVIAQRCSPCHTTATGIGVGIGKLDMTSQATAFTNLVNVPAAGAECTGKGTRVVPGMKDRSILYLKVSLDDPSPCGAKMPLGGPSLAQSEVDVIDTWITTGAQNN